MTAELVALRHHRFESIFNFRDLGGYRTADGRTVAWRRLYRADGMHRMTEADRALVTELGLRTVIDLRTEGEAEASGRFRPLDAAIGVLSHPVLREVWDHEAVDPDQDAVDYLAHRYELMLEEGGPAIASVLAALTDYGTLPAVFHCAAGKDRTGVVAALVLSLLGVPDDDVAADYALSEGAVGRMVDWLSVHRPEMAERMVALPEAFRSAPPEAMHRTLEHLRSDHGGPEGFVASLGVAPGVVERLREVLLE
ncbi:MAG TPA: tyrosine-protein phosphatase [Acidimicrobiales bacterium]|nr:tyrosine-protein phosphatase [Acidimicrobiales bacterium]